MKTLVKFFAITLLISLAACNSMKVTSDYNKKLDFSKIASFRIENGHKGENANILVNELNQKRIETFLNNELTQRGLEEKEDPDVIITYAMNVDSKQNFSTNSTYYGGPYYGRRGWYGGGYGSASSSTHEYTTYDGKLVISMYYAKTKELLWYSGGEKELNMNNKKAEKRLEEAIGKIMEEFPIAKPELEKENTVALNQ